MYGHCTCGVVTYHLWRKHTARLCTCSGRISTPLNPHAPSVALLHVFVTRLWRTQVVEACSLSVYFLINCANVSACSGTEFAWFEAGLSLCGNAPVNPGPRLMVPRHILEIVAVARPTGRNARHVQASIWVAVGLSAHSCEPQDAWCMPNAVMGWYVPPPVASLQPRRPQGDQSPAVIPHHHRYHSVTTLAVLTELVQSRDGGSSNCATEWAAAPACVQLLQVFLAGFVPHSCAYYF